MKRIAILGASSQIARDLILSYARAGQAELLLYGRDPAALRRWLAAQPPDVAVAAAAAVAVVADYADYGQVDHDAVLNFVGVGDPQRAVRMGASIFGVTEQFDQLALRALHDHPGRRYVFLSSGAAYGSGFEQPAGPDTPAVIPINAILPQHYYAVAKLHAEVRHRALPELAITDLRVFNYFSRSQDLDARFFLTDLLRAARDGSVLRTSAAAMTRDYLHPADFHQLLECVLNGPAANRALDCYSAAPVAKATLLNEMARRHGLRYELAAPAQIAVVNATGSKPHYYSLNRQAAELGYHPAYSSLDGVVAESAIILGTGHAAAMPDQYQPLGQTR